MANGAQWDCGGQTWRLGYNDLTGINIKAGDYPHDIDGFAVGGFAWTDQVSPSEQWAVVFIYTSRYPVDLKPAYSLHTGSYVSAGVTSGSTASIRS
jgi:hypothetical protein